MPSLIQTVKNKLQSQGGFLKSVSVLAGGTAFAQALGILVLPIITRIYNPSEFSIFAVYVSIVSIIAIISCLRFEIAIPIPDVKNEAIGLLCLAVISNFCITTICILLVSFFDTQILEVLKQPKLENFLWLIPLGVFLSGIYNALQYWASRQKQFGLIAKTRVSQSITSSVVQMGLGYFAKLGVSGLIIGQLFNFIMGIFKLSYFFWKENKNALLRVLQNDLFKIFKKYDRFPKYSTLDALANTAATQLPIIIIGSLAIGPEAGYLMLAIRVMAMPMGLIGSAISQVYLSHAADAYNEKKLRDLSVSTLDSLYKSGVGILIFIGIASPFIFNFIFGKEWQRAGELITWMTPWFIFQFITSPISMVMHVKNKQRLLLVVTSLGFLFRIGSIFVGVYLTSPYILEIYALSGGIFYFFCYVIFCTVAEVKLVDHLQVIKTSLPIISLFTALGVLMALIMRSIL